MKRHIEKPSKISMKKTKKSFRVLLITLLVSSIVIVALAVGIISSVNSRKSVDDLAFQIQGELTDEIQGELFHFFEKAHFVNQISIAEIEDGVLDLNQEFVAEGMLWHQINVLDSVMLASFGTEEGRYLEVQQSGIEGEYIYAEAGPQTGQNLQLWHSDSEQNHYELIQEVENYDPRQRPWYKSAVEAGAATWSPIYPLASTGEPTISAIQPFYKGDGELWGVFASTLTLSYFERFLSGLTIGENGQAFILQRNGDMVASSQPEKLYEIIDQETLRVNASQSENHLIRGIFENYQQEIGGLEAIQTEIQNKITLDGNQYYLQIEPIVQDDFPDWLIFVVIPELDFTEQVYKNDRYAALIAFFAVLLIMGVGILLARRIVQPVFELSKAAKAMSRGEQVDFLKVHRADEIGELTSSFNEMADQVQDTMSALEKRIEEQRVIQAALRESEEKFRLIVENASEGIMLLDLEGNILEINTAAAEIAEIPRYELLGKNISVFVPELRYNLDEALSYIEAGSKGKSFLKRNSSLIGREGGTKYISANMNPVIKENEIVGISLIVEDVTQSQKISLEMEYLRELLSNIINSMPSMLIGVDGEGLVTHWNRSTEKHTGRNSEEVLSKPLMMVFPDLVVKAPDVLDALSKREKANYSKVQWGKGEKDRYFDIMVYPLIEKDHLGAVIQLDDVTEQVNMEEMMIQSERMLSVGSLAAGMAHEINNPLAGILQNVQVIRNRFSAKMPKNKQIAQNVGTSINLINKYIEVRGIKQMHDNIFESGRRAARIVENMISFSRKSESMFVPHDLSVLLEQTIELAANDYDLKKKFDFRDIKIIREFEDDVPDVFCEGSKIQQVFLNLFKNGAQAMNAGGENQQPPEFILRLRREDEYAVIEVADNGPGMSEELRKRALDPFFTTKTPEQGIGLGLSMSYFIVTKNHNGKMVIESEEGKGTKFIISLPINGIRK